MKVEGVEVHMQLASNFFMALLVFFIQPTFLIGLILAIGTGYKRIKNERTNLRVAIYKKLYEIKNYLLLGLIAGLIGSLLSIGIGMPVTLDWIIIYQLVVFLVLLAGYRFVHPLFTFSLTTLLLLGAMHMKNAMVIDWLPKNWYQPLSQVKWVNSNLITTTLLLIVFLLIISALTLNKHAIKKLSPHFLKTKRGKKVARYQIKPFWVIPLLLVIPGESFGAFFDWWPVFSLGNQTYSFFWLPVLVGFRFTVQAQLPSEALRLMTRECFILAIVVAAAAIGSIWSMYSGIAGLGIAVIGGLFVLYRHRQRENKHSFLFGPTDNGLKVIGIHPETPAEKMGVAVGDTLVSCNDEEIRTEEDFYRALSKNSVYCHLKIKGPDGELRLAESALYADTPHEIGLVLLSN